MSQDEPDKMKAGRYFNAAQLAKSLADENRLRILECLGNEKQSVSALVEKLDLSQPLVSHHLRELKRTCLVQVERKGPFVYYQLANPKILDLVKTLNSMSDILLKSRMYFF